MLKKTLTIITFLLLSSCGYEAIHSKKNAINYDFFITELNFIGDREVNSKIKKKLNYYTLSEKDKNFILDISSSVEKIALAKNISGETTSFKIKVSVSAKVLINNIIKNKFLIIENFNYSNNTNKFDLKKYEDEIKINLAEAISDKLIFKLSNIQ
tara:strand:- start:1296 stop:1760 length:465 start_codon:yes stop_codon:yes gene_type:complete